MEFNNQQAIYLQIAEMICEQILLKKYVEEERIPSVREMAVQLEVNPNTVMRTYDFLQTNGMITNKRGIGYFVATGGLEKATSYRKTAFLEEELPRIFKTAALLQIRFEELLEKFNETKKNTD